MRVHSAVESAEVVSGRGRPGGSRDCVNRLLCEQTMPGLSNLHTRCVSASMVTRGHASMCRTYSYVLLTGRVQCPSASMPPAIRCPCFNPLTLQCSSRDDHQQPPTQRNDLPDPHSHSQLHIHQRLVPLQPEYLQPHSSCVQHMAIVQKTAARRSDIL